MEKKTIKKLLAILMIISILMTDFWVLGSNLITYAMQINSQTNNSNIKFSAYFKNEAGEKVDNIEKSIKSEDLKLYAEINLKGEDGYLEKGTTIEIRNSNFNIISSNKGVVEGNKVVLNQINAGETLEIEFGIKPIKPEKLSPELLTKTSIVKFDGKYIYSQSDEGEAIEAEKTVCATFKPDETAEAELETDIITNKIFSVNGTDKRFVQLLIKSRLSENQYPVKQTTLKVNIPKLNEKMPEEVDVLAIGELATNGQKQITTESWTNHEGVLQINLNNGLNLNDEINWSKNIYDEIVVTLIYAADVDASQLELTTSSEIRVYNANNTYTGTYTKGISNQEPNNIIIGKTEINTEEMYKGQLYANLDTPYNTTSKLIVTNAGIVEEIVMKDGQDSFVTGESELGANTKYITTEVNKEKILEILGQEGNIEIKNGETKTFIDKDTEADENGNIIINHENSTTELEIKTSNPVKAGVLEIKHTKAITQNNYTRNQLQQVTELKTKNNTLGTITVNKEKQNIVEQSTESTIELKETISKAELTIENNKQNLSSTEPNEVTLGVTLVTDEVKYDLYKNPTITLQLPSDVEDVEFVVEPSKINANEFEIVSTNYDATNKTIKFKISGEQKKYAESSATQPYFQLNLKITLSQLATTHTDAITMTYTNQNAIQYYNNGVIQKEVGISAPNKVITILNLEGNTNTSLTESFLQRIENEDAGKNINFKMFLVNNEDKDIKNVRILGKLPTTGNTVTEETNTLETILKNITAQDAEIYYTENLNATEDIEDTTNGWTQDLANLTNAKLYLIKLNTLGKGATYSANISIQLPKTMNESGISYTEYEVIYDTETKNDVKQKSRNIGLATALAASINIETLVQVGNDILTNGDIVKEGEVVKYTVNITNKGNETLKDVKIQSNVPNGTVLVRPIQSTEGASEETLEGRGNGSGYIYAENAYYEEITDNEKIAEIVNGTITELAPNQTYSKQYEVRVNKGSAGTEISNIVTIECDGSTIQSSELKNKIKEANIRVTIKRTIDESIQLLPGGTTRYMVYVENLSNSPIKNLEMQILSNAFVAQRVENDNTFIYEQNGIEKVSIEEVKAKEIMYFSIFGSIKEDAREMNTSIIVKDKDTNKYRSNLLTEKLPYINATISMTSPQNNEFIKEGDIVKYNVTVKNTGNMEGHVSVEIPISEYLKIESVAVNGSTISQSTDSLNTETYVETIANDLNQGVTLQPGQEAQIEIVAKVGFIPELQHGEVVINQATVKIFDIIKDSSKTITHILQSSSTQENVKNVISGLAWLDANGNGQKDAKEIVLQDINVKLYNLTTNNYLIDDDGRPVVTKTNEDGKYSFMKIKNGSYLIIFEYDMNKYEHTTSFAEGVDTTVNSKVILKNINTKGKEERVAAIEILNLQDNIFNMNIGLKEGNGDLPEETPENPEKPGETPETPENPENPGETPENPERPEENRTISGFAWLDKNRNGQKDFEESTLSGIKVRIYNVATNNYLVDSEGNIVETTTDNNGKYIFNKIHDGEYILVYEYDKEKYKPTIYLAEGVDTTVNSKVVLKNININGQEITTAVTDSMNVKGNVFNINIGLKENLIFDLELNKYISKIVVQTSKGTKSYNYNNDTFEKIEINRKQIQGSLVVLEYTIKVKNSGEIAGTARNIVDYVPSGLTFTSELNKDWYLSGNNLYTKALENVEINPGEEKEIKLILTKTMTNNNTGLINNRAEICQDYNKYGDIDIDSTPNNQVQDEDDFGVADVIILVSTGGSTMAYTILLMINAVLIGIAIKLMIRNRIITIPTKKKRR